MAWFENSYGKQACSKQSHEATVSTTYVEPFGEVTDYELNVIEQLRTNNFSDIEIMRLL